MKYQKTLLCIALAGTLIFSGCGSTNNSTGNNTNTSSSVESTVETSREDTDDSTETPGNPPSGDNNSAPSDNGGAPDMSNMTTETINLTDSTIYYDKDGKETTLSALSEGTMVTITLDDDGNAATVTISDNAGGQPGGNTPGGGGSCFKWRKRYFKRYHIRPHFLRQYRWRFVQFLRRSSGTASASLTFPLKIKVPGPEVLFRMKAMPEMAETVMQI